MAKELPYFKFEPSAYDNGKIQLCSFEAQGVFTNICSMYWQRLGDLPYKLALQKICKGNATALESLVSESVVKVIDGMICIDFLNEQLSEFENVSHINSENARSGWEKRRKNATALPTQSDRNAMREDKKREEKIKVDKKKEDPLRAFVDLLDGQLKVSFLEWIQFRKEKGAKITPSTAKKQIQFLRGRDPAVAVAIINQSITMGWTGLFELKHINGNGTGNNGLTKVQQQQANNLQALNDYATTVFGKKPE